MEREETYRQIGEIRQGLGQLEPKAPNRNNLLRKLSQLLSQATEGIEGRREVCNCQVQMLVEQAQALSQDGLNSIQLSLCGREILSQAINVITNPNFEEIR